MFHITLKSVHICSKIKNNQKKIKRDNWR